jgi:hypothetical protein
MLPRRTMRRSRLTFSMATMVEAYVCQKSQKLCQGEQKMNVARDARHMVAAIAGERRWGDTRERWLERAARVLGFSYPRTRALFYCKARVIRAEEWIALNQRIDALKAAQRRREDQHHELGTAVRGAGARLPVAIASDRQVVGRPADRGDTGSVEIDKA